MTKHVTVDNCTCDMAYQSMEMKGEPGYPCTHIVVVNSKFFNAKKGLFAVGEDHNNVMISENEFYNMSEVVFNVDAAGNDFHILKNTGTGNNHDKAGKAMDKVIYEANSLKGI